MSICGRSAAGTPRVVCLRRKRRLSGGRSARDRVQDGWQRRRRSRGGCAGCQSKERRSGWTTSSDWKGSCRTHEIVQGTTEDTGGTRGGSATGALGSGGTRGGARERWKKRREIHPRWCGRLEGVVRNRPGGVGAWKGSCGDRARWCGRQEWLVRRPHGAFQGACKGGAEHGGVMRADQRSTAGPRGVVRNACSVPQLPPGWVANRSVKCGIRMDRSRRSGAAPCVLGVAQPDTGGPVSWSNPGTRQARQALSIADGEPLPARQGPAACATGARCLRDVPRSSC
jgi:hypothetical protein